MEIGKTIKKREVDPLYNPVPPKREKRPDRLPLPTPRKPEKVPV